MIRVLKSLLALSALGALLVGLPIVLWLAGGNPLTMGVPSIAEVRGALSAPDDGTVALAVMRAAGWIVWLLLLVCTAVELWGVSRGSRAPKLPGLSIPQGVVRGLLATAALGLTVGPQAATAVEGPTHHTTANTEQGGQPEKKVATPADLPAGEGVDAPSAAEDAPATESFVHVVATGETLWGLAEKYLGDGRAYRDIVDLNPELAGEEGAWLFEGDEIKIPGQAPSESGVHVVAPGETLWGLAEKYLGDGQRWTELQQANPQVTDPEMLTAGTRLDIPTRADQGEITDSALTASPVEAADDSLPWVEVDQQETPRGPVGVADQGPWKYEGPSPVGQDAPGEQGGAPAPRASTGESEAEPGPESHQDAPWMLAGLAGSGTVLAGGLLLLLRRRRREQFAARRPGRTIAVPPASLAPVEKSINVAGHVTAEKISHMDAALRDLARRAHREGRPLPTVAAVEIGEVLRLYCTQEEDLGAPWEATDSAACWELPWQADVPAIDGTPAPWPLLVTVGKSEEGTLWMLNLECLGKVQVDGPRARREDFLRYIAGELAINPWSAGVTVDCVGLGDEAGSLNPTRVVTHTDYDVQAFCRHVAQQRSTAAQEGVDVPTARAAQVGDEVWSSRVLICAGQGVSTSDLEEVAQALTAEGCHGAAVVVGGSAPEGSVQVHVGEDGRVEVPSAGLDLQAVGLTADEAAGCGALLAIGEDTQDVEVPDLEDTDDPWAQFVDAAGALRTEHQVPRQFESAGVSVLPADDRQYTDVAATSAEDLQVLAPRVSAETADALSSSDPDLDAAWSAWNDPDCPRPKVRLLGPVSATTKGDARVVARRKAYYTELLAFLATRSHGATRTEVADAFGLSDGRVRTDIKVVRDWVGVHPQTGDPYLPSALESPEGKARGQGVYQVLEALTDVDLFRRLRVRGSSAGPEGIADLERALSLVSGTPFSNLRAGGWSWLLEGDRMDQHMLVAVVDVAHTVTVHHLQQGDTEKAREVAQKAAAIAPDESIPQWDLAAVAEAEGKQAERERIVNDACNATCDDEAPRDISEWSQEILDAKGWAHAS